LASQMETRPFALEELALGQEWLWMVLGRLRRLGMAADRIRPEDLTMDANPASGWRTSVGGSDILPAMPKH
jgi:hypothetical protein